MNESTKAQISWKQYVLKTEINSVEQNKPFIVENINHCGKRASPLGKRFFPTNLREESKWKCIRINYFNPSQKDAPKRSSKTYRITIIKKKQITLLVHGIFWPYFSFNNDRVFWYFRINSRSSFKLKRRRCFLRVWSTF